MGCRILLLVPGPGDHPGALFGLALVLLVEVVGEAVEGEVELIIGGGGVGGLLGHRLREDQRAFEPRV